MGTYENLITEFLGNAGIPGNLPDLHRYTEGLLEVLNRGGYEIRETGALYAGPLKATAHRDTIKVEHRDEKGYLPLTVRLNGPYIEAVVGELTDG